MSQSSPVPSSNSSALTLSNKTYNILKHIVAVGLPALSTLYLALASVYHWPDTAAVTATLTAINTFVGGFVVLSSNSYANAMIQYAGDLLISTDGKKNLSLSLSSAVEELEKLGEVLFRVKKGSAVTADPTNSDLPTAALPPVPPA